MTDLIQTPHSRSHAIVTRLKPSSHPKAWGAETWLINHPDYCLKFLDFDVDGKGSCHFHVAKHETWHILEGTIRLDWIDTETSARHTMTLKMGDTVDIPRLVPHQVMAVTNARILEVSTQHFNSDSYRVLPGDGQGGQL
jgi:mannose-6-phosphate isomerase-like protein (cupin superfamily)